MSDKILVNVIITTYDETGSRTPIASRVLRSLAHNLLYPNLHFIIVENSGPNTKHKEMLSTVMDALDISYEYMLVEHKRGVGGSKNAALETAFQTSPIVLLMEDDWYLPQPFNLLPFVQALLDRQNIGVVRFGFLGGDMRASYEDLAEFLPCWRLERNSGLYVYSGQVSLRHKRFYDVLGYHAEGLSPGQEELDMCDRFNHYAGTISDIVWPAIYGTQLNGGPFHNIGFETSLNDVEP